MSYNNDHGAPGRSLLAEMTTLKEQMTVLKTAMLQLVELQRVANKMLLGVHPITDGETPAQVV
jgi:hypothetical protein